MNKTPDLIDFFVGKGLVNRFAEVEDCSDLNSDYSPIILILSETLIKNEKYPRLTTYNTDLVGFRCDLEECIELKVPIKSVV